MAACLTSGCNSTRMGARPPEASPSSPSIAAAPVSATMPDDSWPVADYIRLGMPDPDRWWTAGDYRDARDVLYKLERTQRAALPRLESSKSGPVFLRLINPTNTQPLAEMFLPTKARIQLYFGVVNRMPVYQDIYRFRAAGPQFHRETIELDHAFLRMLGSAVQWDGKPLPPAAGEISPETFHLIEMSRTATESLRNDQPARSVVPKDDRFVIVGAYTAATLHSLLPWLADGTGVTDADRLRAIRYLQSDLPILWRHVRPSQRQEAVSDLEQILRRVSRTEVRRELQALHEQLGPR